MTSTFLFFKVEFWKNCFPGIVDVIDLKWRENKPIWYWIDFVTMPHDQTLALQFQSQSLK